MPTFPPPPLKFRTLGFPQYGFKVSMSDPACPNRREVKPSPSMPSRCVEFAVILRVPPGYGTHRAPVWSPHGQSGEVFATGHATDPRGPRLRPGSAVPALLAYTTPCASLGSTRRFHGSSPLIPRALAGRARRKRPPRPSLLSLACCPHVPRPLRRWVRRRLPLCCGGDARLPRIISASPPTAPVSASNTRRGNPFDAAAFASCCGPCVCPALRTGSDGAQAPPSEDRVTPALGAGRHRATLGVRLDGRTGNLPSSGLAPDQFTTGSEAAQ
jgi:hypothetical protein